MKVYDSIAKYQLYLYELYSKASKELSLGLKMHLLPKLSGCPIMFKHDNYLKETTALPVIALARKILSICFDKSYYFLGGIGVLA